MRRLARRGRALAAAASLLVIAAPTPRQAQQQAAYSADEVKAAFLYHFGTYVRWPAPAANRPLTIAVLGAAPVAKQLAAYLPGRTINGRPVEVRPIERVEDVSADEIVFIGAEFNGRLAQLIGTLGNRPVLIVTDAADGLAAGAMVNFQLVDERVRFEISLTKAQDAGLMLSSRLLSAAMRVQTSSCWVSCGGRGSAGREAVASRPRAVRPPRQRGGTRVLGARQQRGEPALQRFEWMPAAWGRGKRIRESYSSRSSWPAPSSLWRRASWYSWTRGRALRLCSSELKNPSRSNSRS
jgi:hypothetical protein